MHYAEKDPSEVLLKPYLILATLLHFLLLLLLLSQNLFNSTQKKIAFAPILIQIESPEPIPQKKILLNDKKITDTKNPPKNARYFSNQNREVKKETKAPKKQSLLGQKKTNSISDFSFKQHPLNFPQQSLLEPLPEEGSENFLNTKESIYYSFYSRIYETIEPLWQSKISELLRHKSYFLGEFTTLVDIVLDAQGNVIKIDHIEDSPISEFNEAVDLSWNIAKQFPNPPHGLLNDKNEVRMGWKFIVNLSKNFGIQLLPPQQFY